MYLFKEDGHGEWKEIFWNSGSEEATPTRTFWPFGVVFFSSFALLRESRSVIFVCTYFVCASCYPLSLQCIRCEMDMLKLCG